MLCVSNGGSGIWSWPYIFCIAKNNLALLTLLSLPTNYWHCRQEPPRLLHASQEGIKPKAPRKISKHSTNWPAPAACLNLRIDSWLSIVDSKEAVLPFCGVTVWFISGWHTLSALGKFSFLFWLIYVPQEILGSPNSISISPRHPGTLLFPAFLVDQRSAWLNSDHSMHGKGVWRHWSLRFSLEVLHMVILPSPSLASLFPMCMGVKMAEGGPVSQNNHRAEWPTEQQTLSAHSRLGYDWGALKDSNTLN